VFLTKLTINVRSREFRRDFANIHDMHRTVMSAYPDPEDKDAPARQAHAVLWRLDATNTGYIQHIQSRTKPDWTNLPPAHLTQPAEVRTLEPVLDAIRPGRKLAFRLLANATQDTRPAKTKGETIRVAHRTAEAQINWLIRKGERHGFVIPTTHGGVPDVAPSPIPRLTGRKNGVGTITIDAVRFDGHLIVTDPELFTHAVTNGIGRAKAYGCGLLSLAPPRIA
jgi:CRISPR system Cascade subunit CasE